MNRLQFIAFFISLVGGTYGFMCKFKVKNYIQKDKIQDLKKISKIASPIPPKEVLSEEGLKYLKGYRAGMAMLVIGILLFIALSIKT